MFFYEDLVVEQSKHKSSSLSLPEYKKYIKQTIFPYQNIPIFKNLITPKVDFYLLVQSFYYNPINGSYFYKK